MEVAAEMFGEAVFDVPVSAWWLWALLALAGVAIDLLDQRLQRGPAWRRRHRC